MKKRFLLPILLSIVLPVLTILFSSSYPRRNTSFASPSTEYSKAELELRRLQKLYETSKIKRWGEDKELKFVYYKDFNEDDLPNVRAKNYISVDVGTNEILAAKNQETKVPIASLTKVMTAVVALEHSSPEALVKVSKKAADIGENEMGIDEGEVYSLSDLLYGLILNSGNDAAYAISEGVAGNVDDFVFFMNKKAEELGLNNTKFYDPSGLNDDTYSTAYDLAKLTRYALKINDFRRIAGTYEHEISAEPGKHKYLFLRNQTNLLTTYPGNGGIKTGYTEAAGLCLISYANNSGVEIISVLTASDARKTDMIQILDASYLKRGIRISHPLLDM